MKVICISDKYNPGNGILSFDYFFLTTYKIYDVVIIWELINSNWEKTDCESYTGKYKTLFRIKCDDGTERILPEEMVLPIDLWREIQFNKLLY